MLDRRAAVAGAHGLAPSPPEERARLMVMVDDATGRTQALMAPQERTRVVLIFLESEPEKRQNTLH